MHTKKILGAIFTFVMVFATFSVVQPQISTEALIKIDANLVEQMEEGEGPLNAIVKVLWNPDLEPIKFNHDKVISELKAEAARTQEPVITYLKQKRDAEILNTFWLSNMMLIKADESTIRELATLTTVESILMDFKLTVPPSEFGGEPSQSGTVTWNIEKVRAPEVWAMGIAGEGIRFATTDTGVEPDHPDLVGTLFTANPADPKCPGGWIEYDANGIPIWSAPHDTAGHGTATYGLIVGDAAGPYGSVGMAPGAKGYGMHALTLPEGGGYWPQVLAGLQWVIDPFDEAGNKYPMARVSSHSWGPLGGGYICELIEACENMYAAGHLTIASIGNDYEGTSGSPGNYYSVFGVGATDINDNVAAFSSGEWVYKTDFACTTPAWWPDKWLKPDVSAPGDAVIVPYWGKTWRSWEGTSFSSPHVGGAAVLMLSGNPSLNPDEIREALQETAVWYNRYYPSRPDTRYGWGRIDAYEAVMKVALPQGVRGHVSDAGTGNPISEAKVYCEETDRSVLTDANGYYDMRLLPGTYTLTFSRFGYGSTTVPGVVVTANQFTTLDAALIPVPPGYVAGHVYYEPTGIGIPGALVEALDVPSPVKVETDFDGYYVLAIPPSTYDFKASAYGFKEDTVEDMVVVEGQTTTVNFYLTQPPKVAVVGDYAYPPGKIVPFLQSMGYDVDHYSTVAAVIPYVVEYSTIVVSYPGSTTKATVDSFIAATDANGVGVVWLDSWASYTGGYILYYNTVPRWPPYRYTSYSSSIQALYYKVTTTDDDIIPGWSVGSKIIHDDKSYYKDHAYYTGILDNRPDIGSIKVLASIGRRYSYGDVDVSGSQGIAKVTRTNNKWMLLSMHANTPYTDVSYWTADTKTVFTNSINWVAKPHVGIAKFVKWGLKAEPEETLWKDPVTISAGIKNLGWITGTHTVKMYVDSTLEGSATVTLAPGEYTYPSWTVSRFEVGTYKVTVQHLTTAFRVRPPEIEVKAYEFCSDQPLAGADIYGYYRKYVAPGWYEQWSQAYGGNGHSQHAQPIGDIDEDGTNEVIVGGYESFGMCRILSFDAAQGKYVEEYSWYVPGGSYHSPSGSTVLDLDEDGDLEFVISWSYSGADGIYAYDWDGTTLTELNKYLCGFVFDVYSCDYDDDGHEEVLIANAPNIGATPWHIIAFRWESGAFVPEAYWKHSSYMSMECPMIWSGDVDNDGKTEVVGCLSNSASSTAGTWALHWDSGTGAWIAEQVYATLIGGGTHYGVVVGDVDDDGTPEIGIGNNVGGYVGAGAVLVEWTGTAYAKVWEGSWTSEYCVIEALAIGDADNDGKYEFAAGGGNVHIIGWTGTSYAEEATITQTAGMLSGAIIGDCDSDGKNELKACDIIGYGPGKEWIFKYAEVPTPEPAWTFKYFGKTDANGMLVFDSPASVVEMYLFVYKPEKTQKGYQYLLEKDLLIDNDITITYKPHKETEAVVKAYPEESSLKLFEHLAIEWLWKLEVPVIWPFPTWYSGRGNPLATNIVVSPSTYSFIHELYINDAWGTWKYYMLNPNNRVRYLPAGATYQYGFAGPVSGYVTSDQVGNKVTINWDVTDSKGHQITGVICEEAGPLSSASNSAIPKSFTPAVFDEYKAVLAAKIEHKPLITLYDSVNKIVKTGYVEWDEKPAQTTADSPIAYAILRFKAGPYGDPAPEEIVWWIKEPYP